MPSIDEIYGTPAVQELEPAPLALLTDRQQAKLDFFAPGIETLKAKPLTAPPSTREEAAALTDLLSWIKTTLKDLEESRRQTTDPLNERVKKINAKYKPFTDALESAEKTAKRFLGAWLDAEEARVQRERLLQQKAQEEAAAREGEALAKAEAATTAEARQEALRAAELASQEQALATVSATELTRGVRTEMGTASRREHWTAKVVDAAKVPRSFLIPDEKAIRNAVACGVREIPGVAITLEVGIQVRT